MKSNPNIEKRVKWELFVTFYLIENDLVLTEDCLVCDYYVITGCTCIRNTFFYVTLHWFFVIFYCLWFCLKTNLYSAQYSFVFVFWADICLLGTAESLSMFHERPKVRHCCLFGPILWQALTFNYYFIKGQCNEKVNQISLYLLNTFRLCWNEIKNRFCYMWLITVIKSDVISSIIISHTS